MALGQGALADEPSFVNTGPYSLVGAIRPFLGDKITSFDISWVDPVRKRYYLANRTSQDLIVVDTTTNQIVGNFKPGFKGFQGSNDTAGPDGVFTTENEIYVGDAPSQVWALEPNSGAPVVNPIKTSDTSSNRADEGCYDPAHKIAAFVNNADSPPFITFISTTDHSVLKQIVFDGTGGTPNATDGAEQCQWNPRDQNIYLSIPEVGGAGDNSSPGAVVVFDMPAMTINRIMSIPLAACTGPQGLTIGPSTPTPQIGLGCNVGVIGGSPAANEAIISDSGAVLMSFPGKGGGDEIWYDPGNNKYFFAARQAPGGEALFIIDAATFAVQRLFTGAASNAHSVAADPFTNVAYVPTSSAATSHLCSSMGAVDADGCILLFGPPPTSTPPPACTLASELGDFNGDGKDDILLRRSDGLMSQYFMNGFQVTSAQVLGANGVEWTLTAVADFNGDGKADLLFRRGDGQLSIYLLNGSQVLAAQLIGGVDPHFEFVGAGDFNGDGRADILFRRPSDGMLALFLMNGFQVIGSQFFGGPGPEWRVRGVRDFNGDGLADILFRRTNDGLLALFLMNGFQNIGASLIGGPGPEFSLVGTRDFNGDGRADMLFRRADGLLALVLVNGFQVLGAQTFSGPGPEFSVLGLGDLNGDGRSDIVFRRVSDGLFGIVLMNGFQVLGAQFLSGAGTEWSACYGQPPLSVSQLSQN
jgi:hypothetical protein